VGSDGLWDVLSDTGAVTTAAEALQVVVGGGGAARGGVSGVDWVGAKCLHGSVSKNLHRLAKCVLEGRRAKGVSVGPAAPQGQLCDPEV
jgi:hypothetical protein